MIGQRISKNMVVIGHIATLSEFLIAVDENRSIYHRFMGMRPARVYANMQFKDIAYGILHRRFYSIIHYKQLQCAPPPKRVSSAKTTSKRTKKASPEHLRNVAVLMGRSRSQLLLPPARH